jgi:trimeric autotransporter adhesin
MRKFVFGGSYASAVPLLLDTYPAAAAYSLRKLRNGYTGAAIRVRRSSDNTETDIGFVGNDLDTASLLSFVGAGNGFATTWYDQQGSFNVTQSTLANQPQIVASGVTILRGGKPALKFDGSNDQLDRASGIVNATDSSHFSVSNNDVSNSNGAVFASSNSTNASVRIFNDRRLNKLNLAITTGSGTYLADMSTSRNVADIRLLSSFIDASKGMSAFDNGATGTTNTYVGTFVNNGIRMGVQGDGASSRLNGTIQELILFNTNESANRTAIESNINTYYGIY